MVIHTHILENTILKLVYKYVKNTYTLKYVKIKLLRTEIENIILEIEKYSIRINAKQKRMRVNKYVKFIE